MKRAELAQIFGMEPKEAYEFLASKGLKPTFSYTELQKEAHASAFTVAKMMKLDLLRAVHRSLAEALKSGKRFDTWKEEIVPQLKRAGWWGEVDVVDPRTGEVARIRPASRLRTIFETNIRTAYATGRYAHMQKSSLPYWMYVSALLETTRPKHRAMHGTVLPKDHPFWERNYPPNGYNCRCKVRAYSKKQLQKRGITPVEGDVPDVADKGWDYNPGKAGYERLKTIWRQKIADAPKEIGKKSAAELELFELYESAFETDQKLKEIMLAFMPNLVLQEDLDIPARYHIPTQTILFQKKPPEWILRHESGHHLDAITGFVSDRLAVRLKKDAALWRLKKEEIEEVLRHFENDPAILDLFYLTSKGVIDLYPTRKKSYITDGRITKEAFANFFEIYLSGDEERIEILRKFFKYSYNLFMQLIDEIKEQL